MKDESLWARRRRLISEANPQESYYERDRRIRDEMDNPKPQPPHSKDEEEWV